MTLIFGDNKSAQCGTASNQTPKGVIGNESSYCDRKHFENDLYSFVKQLVQVFPNSIFLKYNDYPKRGLLASHRYCLKRHQTTIVSRKSLN